MQIFTALKNWLQPPSVHFKRSLTERELISRESAIGSQLFGPIQHGGRREFFCLDSHAWIWHEEWVDAQGRRQVITTRYDIRDKHVIKTQNNLDPHVVSGDELANLRKAVDLYYRRVAAKVYNRQLAW